jgi:cellulose biosynthesis protein BcsQ
VIVVGMLKGGTGKTTSAWFIALYYAVVLGLPTLLLDADATSQSAYDWFKVATAEGFAWWSSGTRSTTSPSTSVRSVPSSARS